MVGPVSSCKHLARLGKWGFAPGIVDPGKEDRAAHGIPVVLAFDGYRGLRDPRNRSAASARPPWRAWSRGLELVRPLVQGTLNHFVDILFNVGGFGVLLPTVARRGCIANVLNTRCGAHARLVRRLLGRAGDPGGSTSVVAGSTRRSARASTTLPFTQHSCRCRPASSTTSELSASSIRKRTLSLEVTFYVVLPFIAAWYSPATPARPPDSSRDHSRVAGSADPLVDDRGALRAPIARGVGPSAAVRRPAVSSLRLVRGRDDRCLGLCPPS